MYPWDCDTERRKAIIMPLKVAKIGKKFVVQEPGGSLRGTHSTRKAAVKQIQAININKAKKRGRK